MTSFKKRNVRRNIRERKKDDEEIDDTSNQATPTNISKASPTTSKPLLSFEDELEEAEEFKLKKKKSRHKANLYSRERKSTRQEVTQEMIVECMEDEETEGGGGGGRGGDGVGEPTVIDKLTAGIVPDAITIHAIRKKRQLARNMGGASLDYIPLEQQETKGDVTIATGKSRLVREDENDKSDEEGNEDEGSHMTFYKRDEPGRQMQVLTALENLNSDSEDEETKRWEEEQINKGMKASNVQPLEEVTFDSFDPLMQSMITGNQYHHDSKRLTTPKPLNIKFIPITLENWRAKLEVKLKEAKDSLNDHKKQLEQVEADLKDALELVSVAESDQPSLEPRYLFYQQMKGYLQDLLSCLAVKAPLIKSLEAKICNLRQQDSLLLVNRRRQDVRDETNECMGVASEGDGGARQRRSTEREARRRRRRERREKKEIWQHDDGLSSDDEMLESDKVKYTNELESLNEPIAHVFEDVIEDFTNLEVIKARLEQWKFSYNDGYRQAYVSLCLPKIFAPYVRYEMLHWDPLASSPVPIESMKWFGSLIFYCYQEGVDPDPSDDDVHLVPQIIDRVVMSKFISVVQRVWDPLSSSQTHNLINNIRYVVNDFPTVAPQTKNLQDLKASLVKRFQESLAEDIFIPLMNKNQLEVTNTKSYHFYQRQFWTCMKLLGNILYCQGVLPDDILSQLVLDGLVNCQIILSLQNSPVDELTIRKTSTLLNQLPQQWLTTDNKSVESIKRYLYYLQDTLQRMLMSSTNEKIKKDTRKMEDTVLELRTLLLSS